MAAIWRHFVIVSSVPYWFSLPSLDTNCSSEEVKDTLQKALNPSNVKVGIKNVRKLAKNGVAVECNSRKDLEALIKGVNTDAGLSSTLEAKIPAKKFPRVIIYNVDDSISQETLGTNLASQNEQLKREDFKVLFNLKSKNQGKSHWVIEVRPKAFRPLLRKKKIYHEWQRLSIREFLRPTRCYKCNHFGHISSNCSANENCPNCGQEGHKMADCSQAPRCINCDDANKKFKLGYEIDHAASDANCSSLQHQIQLLINRTDYGR
ncbi:hypothetical protein AVEN_235983-1 [Araneus ventricosus]|uniref:CCHC-type domain-containing protein n=1 Tax=Araneus ventricosus TaxID=182803 RepID=A0A4Y2SW86_ARAVE|nr:hypothetical protein AVEN_235983-1 [Araneus ventricosus]